MIECSETLCALGTVFSVVLIGILVGSLLYLINKFCCLFEDVRNLKSDYNYLHRKFDELKHIKNKSQQNKKSSDDDFDDLFDDEDDDER